MGMGVARVVATGGARLVEMRAGAARLAARAITAEVTAAAMPIG